MEKVKIGFVGCGYMGQLAHLPNFVNSEKCEVVALAEKREKLGKAVAEKYHISRLYASHRQLCEDEGIDAVVEITTDALHAPIALDCLNAGKHLFTEKPMATTLADANRMVESAEKNRVKLMVGYMKRYDPGVEKARQLVKEFISTGELGRVTFVRAHCFGGDWVCNIGKPITTDETSPEIQANIPDWLPQELTKEFLGFNNVYCHNINLLRFFLGEVKEVKTAELGKSYPSGKVVVLDFGDFLGCLEVGGISSRWWDEETKIYFEQGWIELLTPPPLLRNVPAEVKVYKGGEIQQMLIPYSAWDWSFRRSAEHFLDCIITDQEPTSSGRDSRKDMKIVEEIFKKYLGL
ncbi:MAG: Gfo/Idh/MocA family oxidoreductase [Candidatus Latescibacteria bacterium]|nr:Gfo/Idh/MocA family oxidoreductase [Candidatus Latescibacterota bacterium]